MTILLSSGTFIGRVNDRNYKLLTEHHTAFCCDGFELMVFPCFYPYLEKIIDEFINEKINIPVLHFDKDIGDGIGSADKSDYSHALSLLDVNLRAADRLGAKKAVIHLWGRQDSDKNSSLIYARAGEIAEKCEKHGVLPVFENIFCCVSSPLHHLETLSEMYPEMCFTLDTRPAQFHNELRETLESPVMKHVKHIHANDYDGGYKEWARVNPIRQPGDGNIDWEMFFSYIKSFGYDGTVTLEAPSAVEKGVDAETLNKSLDFIRRNLYE